MSFYRNLVGAMSGLDKIPSRDFTRLEDQGKTNIQRFLRLCDKIRKMRMGYRP